MPRMLNGLELLRGYAKGRVILKSRPPVLRFSAVMLPPWIITAFLTIERPNPVPPAARLRPLSTR